MGEDVGVTHEKEKRPGRASPADHRPPAPSPCSWPGRGAEPPRSPPQLPRTAGQTMRDFGGTKAAGLGLLNTSEARRAARFIGLGEKTIIKKN